MTPEVRNRIEQIRHGIVPEGYKKVGSDIIPSDWSKSPFSQLGVISSGLVNPKEQPYFKMQHIGPDNIEKDTGRILETQSAAELRLISGKFYFDSDSIVYSKIRPNFNKVCAPHFEGICSADCYSIKPTDNVDKAYLLNLMLGYSFYKRAVECSMRTGMPKINQDDLNTIAMCYPKSIDEQKKIAEILTTQDKVIELERQKIEEIKKAKKFLLSKMFPKKGQAEPEIRFKGFTGVWEQRKLGEVSDSYSGGTPTVGVKEYYGGQIPFIRSAEINSDYTEIFITEDGLKNSSARLVSQGDILYALYGATSGEVGRARLNGAINQAILAIKPYAGYDCEFISQWLRKSKQSIVETYLQGGQGNLSGAIVKELLVDFPTLEEQQAVGAYFKQFDNLITLHQRKFEEEKKKKKSLMQLLLTGIVRV